MDPAREELAKLRSQKVAAQQKLRSIRQLITLKSKQLQENTRASRNIRKAEAVRSVAHEQSAAGAAVVAKAKARGRRGDVAPPSSGVPGAASASGSVGSGTFGGGLAADSRGRLVLQDHINLGPPAANPVSGGGGGVGCTFSGDSVPVTSPSLGAETPIAVGGLATGGAAVAPGGPVIDAPLPSYDPEHHKALLQYLETCKAASTGVGAQNAIFPQLPRFSHSSFTPANVFSLPGFRPRATQPTLQFLPQGSSSSSSTGAAQSASSSSSVFPTVHGGVSGVVDDLDEFFAGPDPRVDGLHADELGAALAEGDDDLLQALLNSEEEARKTQTKPSKPAVVEVLSDGDFDVLGEQESQQDEIVGADDDVFDLDTPDSSLPKGERSLGASAGGEEDDLLA
jgi:hypothetical protein